MSLPQMNRRNILELLKELESTHGVKVLFAVESGSREWGFASRDSDHDIRAVHFGPPEAYLGLFPPKEQIELMNKGLEPPMDVVSWDIKKFASLLLKSNPGVSEWLQSKQVYVDSPYRAELRELFQAGFSPFALKKHYVSLARKNYEKYVRDKEDVNLKRYVYVLRALACLGYLNAHGQHMPPLNYQEVIGYLPDEVATYMEHIVQLKRKTEGMSGKCSEPTNRFIESHFTMEFEKSSANFDVQALNELVVEIIRS